LRGPSPSSNGSAQAILDGVTLAPMLRASNDWPAVLKEYESIRLKATGDVVLANREIAPDAVLRVVHERTGGKPFGVIGLVIDAGVRDLAALRDMKFPVWSRAVNAKGTVKATVGSVNVSVVCAGMWVQPGDAIVADDDGVVVVPRTRVAEVAAAAEQREAKEEATRARLAQGELGLDIYSMRDKLAAAGLRYADRAPVTDR